MVSFLEIVKSFEICLLKDCFVQMNVLRVLYPYFYSPWTDSQPSPGGAHEHFNLPFCYYMQPPALKTSHLSKFKLETLFYIFYNMPRDALQVYTAKEL